jgi:hypothetical protein
VWNCWTTRSVCICQPVINGTSNQLIKYSNYSGSRDFLHSCA